jgi:hypothetical protein
MLSGSLNKITEQDEEKISRLFAHDAPTPVQKSSQQLTSDEEVNSKMSETDWQMDVNSSAFNSSMCEDDLKKKGEVSIADQSTRLDDINMDLSRRKIDSGNLSGGCFSGSTGKYILEEEEIN